MAVLKSRGIVLASLVRMVGASFVARSHGPALSANDV